MVFDVLRLSEDVCVMHQLDDEEQWCNDAMMMMIKFITDSYPDRARKVLITEENVILHDGILYNIYTTPGLKAQSYAKLVIPLRLGRECYVLMSGLWGVIGEWSSIWRLMCLYFISLLVRTE